MKDLLSQNSFKLCTKEIKVFVCNKCSAIFQSDEYIIEMDGEKKNFINYIDKCFTCQSNCIISEKVDAES